MEVTALEDQPELTDDLHAFIQRTGLLNYYKDLEWIGFTMFSFAGHFMASSVPELLDFCDKNPSYHIVTVTRSGYYENRFVPGKRVYYLAEGDKNPGLVLNLFLHKSPELFAEEGFAQALAILYKGDGGTNGE